MTKRLQISCVATLALVACGRTVGEGDSGESGSTSSSGGDDSTVTVTTTITTTAATMTTTTDATTMTDATDTAVDSSTGAAETTTGGGSTSCCEAHATPGCDDDTVSQCVCDQSADCCVFEWSDACVELATGDCAATCMGGETTAGSTSGSTTGSQGGACNDVVEIDLDATMATLDGDWQLTMSMLGEGMIAAIDPNAPDPMGTVHWDIDIPCDDDWYIWVRAVDYGADDSFFAQLDAAPDPAPIFEVGCDFNGMGYTWRVLDQRDLMAMPCEYVEDPWIAQWQTGPHTFDLMFRESIAVARIIVTNDETFVPM